jgi:hypothetical protein
LKTILIKNYKKSVDKGFSSPHIDYAKGEQIMTVKQTTLELESLKQTLNDLQKRVKATCSKIKDGFSNEDALPLIEEMETTLTHAQVVMLCLSAQIKIKG